MTVNYALDPASLRYITGKFVSITQDSITLERSSPRNDGDQRRWHATIDLESVFMIQSAQD